jgi:hypothetical protein
MVQGCVIDSRLGHLAVRQVGEAGRVPWCLVVMTAKLYQLRAGLSVPWMRKSLSRSSFGTLVRRRDA